MLKLKKKKHVYKLVTVKNQEKIKNVDNTCVKFHKSRIFNSLEMCV
jgi:hypothetical protein